MKTRVFALTLVILAVFLGFCSGFPEPAIVPDVGDWTLDVVFEHPQQISVQLPGESVKKRFWYTILAITNNTGQDASFYPSCELVTDTFQITTAGKNVRKIVFDRVKLRHQGKYPFLEYIEHSDSRILQGSDNRKDIAIIWSDFDSNAKNVSLFIAGLSNETVAIDHPTERDSMASPVKVYLRKTLGLDYSIGGDPSFRASAQLTYKDKRWVMR